MSYPFEKLDQKAENRKRIEDANQWDPADGEVLEGIVIYQRTLDNEFGTAPLYYIEKRGTDEVVSVLARHAALQQRMDGVGTGDLVRIEFQGEIEDESVTGGSYYGYDVVSVDESRVES